MSPDTIETYRVLVAAQEAMARDITDIKVFMGRMDTKLANMCRSATQEHDDCLRTRENIEKRLESHEQEHDRIWKAVTTISVKWKVATGLVAAIVTTLTILNILLSLGVRL